MPDVDDGQVSIGPVLGGFVGVALVFANSDSLSAGWRDVVVATAAAVSLLSVAVFGRARGESRVRSLAAEHFDRTWALIALFGIAGLVATVTTDSDDAVALVGVGSGVVLLVNTLASVVSHRGAATGGPGQPIRGK